MKSKLIVVAVVIAAGVTGFWAGGYRTRQVWERVSERRAHQTAHYLNWAKVHSHTHVLQYLADGNVADARGALERQLDVALVQVVAYEKLYDPEGRGAIELQAVRNARDYRSHHQWVSEVHNAEAVQQAFKWAD